MMNAKNTFDASKMLLTISLSLMIACVSCKQASNFDYPDESAHLFTYGDAAAPQLVKHTSEWPQKRAEIISGMEQAMGKLPARPTTKDFQVKILDSLTTDVYTRYNITFRAAEGEDVPAYLYVPIERNSGKKIAAMLALHPTGELGKRLTDGQGKPDRAYAKELADRGYVVIAPDYPSFGDLTEHDFKTDRYESGTMQAIFYHMRSVDLLQSLGYVDPARMGVIGHSLGGHNAMFAGAFDERLKVIVSSCGWTLMDYYNIGEEASKRYGGRLGPWAQDRYMPLLRDKFELDGEKFPFDFDEVIAALAPRTFLSVSPVRDSNFDVEGVRKGIESASAIYRFMGAGENILVRYPDAAHDFTPESRLEAYRLIDKVLQHTPLHDEIR